MLKKDCKEFELCKEGGKLFQSAITWGKRSTGRN